MVLPGEQSERDSANRQKNCVNAKPKPVSRKFSKAYGGKDQKNDSCHQKPAKDMKRLQPRIDGIAEDHDMFKPLAKGNHGCQNENQFTEANDSREKIKKAIRIRAEQWALIFSANPNRDRPEKYGQEREQQISTNH